MTKGQSKVRKAPLQPAQHSPAAASSPPKVGPQYDVLCTSAIGLATATCYTSRMAKKITLGTIASLLTEQRKEIKDLTETVAHVVKHMATKEDLEKLATKEQLFVLQ